VDQRSADPSVAVGERVDRLELRMNQCRLKQRPVGRAGEVVSQVLDEAGDLIGRRRHEIGVERMPVGGDTG